MPSSIESGQQLEDKTRKSSEIKLLVSAKFDNKKIQQKLHVFCEKSISVVLCFGQSKGQKNVFQSHDTSTSEFRAGREIRCPHSKDSVAMFLSLSVTDNSLAVTARQDVDMKLVSM